MEITVTGADPDETLYLHPDDGCLEDRGSCPYLPDRRWFVRYTADPLTPWDYEQGLVDGWRRSAMVFYRPVCPGCSQCIPIRIDGRSWRPGTRMRRLMKHNRDIDQVIGFEYSFDESFRLYLRYAAARHGVDEIDDETTRAVYEAVYCLDYFYHPRLSGFLSPDREYRSERTGSRIDTRYSGQRRAVDYRDQLMRDRTLVLDYRRKYGGTLIANGYIDILPTGISSVYFTFDPDESKRSLGIWSIGKEIELTMRLKRHYYYLGFWVPGSRSMDYKASFPPFELAVNGRWISVATREDALALAATLPGFVGEESSSGISP